MSQNGYIFDIKKFSVNDGPGIRTTVFLKGCPLNCWWCHNPESQNMKPEKVNELSYSWSFYSQSCSADIIGKEVTADEVFEELVKDIPFYEESGGGVTFSGGEPMLQLTFLKKLLELCSGKNIQTAVDTTGFTPFSNFDKIYEQTDLFLYDIKIFEDELHKLYTGVSNRIILNNLEKLSMKGNKVILRIPLIPGITDYEDNISKLIAFIKDMNIREVNLLPYHNSASSKYRRLNKESKLGQLIPQTPEQLTFLKKRFSETGIPVSIGG
jgi:pyruvate formate lyase activating enzyme